MPIPATPALPSPSVPCHALPRRASPDLTGPCLPCCALSRHDPPRIARSDQTTPALPNHAQTRPASPRPAPPSLACLACDSRNSRSRYKSCVYCISYAMFRQTVPGKSPLTRHTPRYFPYYSPSTATWKVPWSPFFSGRHSPTPLLNPPKLSRLIICSTDIALGLYLIVRTTNHSGYSPR